MQTIDKIFGSDITGKKKMGALMGALIGAWQLKYVVQIHTHCSLILSDLM